MASAVPGPAGIIAVYGWISTNSARCETTTPVDAAPNSAKMQAITFEADGRMRINSLSSLSGSIGTLDVPVLSSVIVGGGSAAAQLHGVVALADNGSDGDGVSGARILGWR
eukprot:CAMPEP_0178618204 /NCGR_PEP_ID=MMETSP0698-20121128/4118_1 /TAXON_ID=265572 /ORGANISM="Extubocellulus spinifer, Strain CCMP396" /LENGTH=110 /DNA_ID=CAMNT_0020257081 /DNA_START=190 /DNA_END=522 /DNA_ORIENTATION=-